MISIQNLFLGKLIFQPLQKVSEANIWFAHFELNVLEVDMVSFTEAFILSAREGGKHFEHPVDTLPSFTLTFIFNPF